MQCKSISKFRDGARCRRADRKASRSPDARSGKSRTIAVLFAALLALAYGAPVSGAQTTYPTRPIELVNPFGAGGDSDVSGRGAAKAAEKFLRKPIITVNRPGAGGAIGFASLHAARPDGYTIGWVSSSLLTASNLGNVKFSYSDLEHIALMARIPTVIAVKADAPWKTFRDFIQYAKSKPRAIRLGDSGTGSFTYVAAKALEDITGVEFSSVPVGAQRRVASLLGGEVEASIVHPGEVLAQFNGKQIRFLAISGANRNPQFADVPTFKELGVDVGVENFRSVAAPKGVQKEVIAALANAYEKASREKEWLQVATNLGYEPIFLGPQEHAKFMADQNARIKSILKKVKIVK
jgi:tripartite-type tricarboxylate transporter receptor subunit TctC